MSDWRYYNHALIPALPPHSTPDISELNKKWANIAGGHPLLARWTTEFDCSHETNWWYVICDKPFDISDLNSKKRNVIRNGLKYCDVLLGDPLLYEKELLELYNEAQTTYKNSKKIATAESFHKYLLSINSNSSARLFLCLLKETGDCVGYALVIENEEYCELQSQKARPSFEKYQVNAALVNAILNYYKNKLESSKRFYICDGARNINHETHFQDYLQKYFGFRKAYCKLHVKYAPTMRFAVRILFHFRKVLLKFDSIGFVHLMNGVLKMEEIVKDAR